MVERLPYKRLMVGSTPPRPNQMSRRVDIKALLANNQLREKLLVKAIVALQAREGIVTSEADALRAYRKVRKETLEKKKRST